MKKFDRILIQLCSNDEISKTNGKTTLSSKSCSQEKQILNLRLLIFFKHLKKSVKISFNHPLFWFRKALNEGNKFLGTWRTFETYWSFPKKKFLFYTAMIAHVTQWLASKREWRDALFKGLSVLKLAFVF